MTTEEMTTGEDITQTDVTTPPPRRDLLLGVGEDVVITLSVVVPASIGAIIGIRMCYIQYKKSGGGWKWGSFPCRRGKKFKDSNETLNSQDNCAVVAAGPTEPGLGVCTLADKVQDLGCNNIADLDAMQETELFTASPSSNAALPIPLSIPQCLPNWQDVYLSPPIPSPMPRWEEVPQEGSDQFCRTRPYYPRAAKQRNPFDFDPEKTTQWLKENKKK